jgi:hypothetical protein
MLTRHAFPFISTNWKWRLRLRLSGGSLSLIEGPHVTLQIGATTLGTTTLSLTTLGITALSAGYNIDLILNVANQPCVIMLSVIILSIFSMCVIKLSVIMLSGTKLGIIVVRVSMLRVA